MANREVSFRMPAINWLIGLVIAMIGYTIHNSIFWAIMDYIFWPFAIIKWVIFQEINLTIIKQTFDWFLK